MKTTKLPVLTILLLLFSSSYSFGQSFGVGAGTNFSNLHFSGDFDDELTDSYKTLLGLNVGGFYDLNFSESTGLRFGMKYSTRGTHLKYEQTYTSIAGNGTYTSSIKQNFKIRLNYIQLNPMFKYEFSVGVNNGLYLLIGPYVSVGLGGKQSGSYDYTETFNDGAGNISTTTDSDVINEKIEIGHFDLIDFGLTPAIGFNISSFFIEACYDFGLNNIDTDNNSNSGLLNRNLSIGVGYKFGE